MTSPAVAGVVSLADAGVASLANLAGGVTVGVASLADAGVSSPANLAGGFIVGVASPVVAGVAPLVDAGMASLADLVGGSPSECSLCSLLGSPLWDDGPPWTSSGDLINSVVHTSGPNSPDGPSDTDRLHRTGPGLRSRSTVLFVSRPDGSGGPCEEDSPPQTGSDTPLHCGVRILPPGPCGPGVKDDDISESTVANAPGMHLLCA